MRKHLFGVPVLLFVSLVMWTLLLVPDFFGRLEGKYLGGVSGARITKIIEADGNSSIVWGQFHKDRACPFVSLEFRIFSPSGYSIIKHEFLGQSKVRGIGFHEFGPWKIHATPDQIKHAVASEVRQRCHPLFDTITKFYPPA